MKQKIKQGYKAVNIQTEFNAETNEVETKFDMQINPKKGDFVNCGDVVLLVESVCDEFLNYSIIYNLKTHILSLSSSRQQLYYIDSYDSYASSHIVDIIKEKLIQRGKVFNEETKEIKDAWQPKVGDICVYNLKNEIIPFIFLGFNENDECEVLCEVFAGMLFINSKDKNANKKNIQKATLEEEKTMMDIIASEGYRLSKDRTKLIRVRKRVKKGEHFYVITLHTEIVKFTTHALWENTDDYTNKYYNGYNYFLTEEAAQRAADELNAKLDLKEFFKNSKEE